MIINTLIYRTPHKRKQQRLQEAYESAVKRREELLKELDTLKAQDYDTLISQMEEKIKEQNQQIALFEDIHKKIAIIDKLSNFEQSDIVQLFHQKRSFRKDNPSPTQDEWNELIIQFRKDLPSAYAAMSNGKRSLSNLQLRVCILLLLDFDESTIASLLESTQQNVNNAKTRANQKLFNALDSSSLKSNLNQLMGT